MAWIFCIDMYIPNCKYNYILNLRQSMKSFLNFLNESAKGQLHHIWESDNITFANIRDIFTNLFKGNLELTNNINGIKMNVTCKDGHLMGCLTDSVKDILDMDTIKSKFAESSLLIDAFDNSMKDVEKAIRKLPDHDVEQIFKDGHNFMELEINFPTDKNLDRFGGKCLIQFKGLNKYDNDWNCIGPDEDCYSKLYNSMKGCDALNQKIFEVAEPARIKIKNSIKSESALADILSDLDRFVDGIGYNATLEDYVKERYIRKIVNAATAAGINVRAKSDFVDNIASRLSQISGRRPTRNEISIFAKRDGINIKKPEYRDFLNKLDASVDDDNTEILEPIENLVVKAGTMLIKNLAGFVSADKSEAAQKLSKELDDALIILQKSEKDLTPQKLHLFLKNLKKLDAFGKTSAGIDGIVFMWKDQIMKMTSNFGAISQLLNIMKCDM